MKRQIIFSFIFIIIFLGCGTVTATDTNKSIGNKELNVSYALYNQALPIVNIEVDSRVATVNEIVILKGKVIDNNRTIISYEWKKGGFGVFEEVLGTEPTLIYIPTAIGIDTLILTVMDDNGVTASESIDIFVTDKQENNTNNEEVITSPIHYSEDNESGFGYNWKRN